MGRPLGPGPGAYLLPPTVGYEKHDGTKYRNPMYSFGMNHRYDAKKFGPGPTYMVDRMNQYGYDCPPAWTLGSRIPTRKAQQSPGPAAHAPEKCPLTKEPRPPCYSLGARLGRLDRSRGPAPNAYRICFGPGSPAFSMGARFGHEWKSISPGPAVYYQKCVEAYQPSAPKYSLGGSLGGGRKSYQTPGPAAYPPNMYNQKKCPPNYSFGVKHCSWCSPLIIDEDAMDCL